MTEEGSVSTRPVADGTMTDLHAHLVAAVDLELWTIPPYLTAVFYIRNAVTQVFLAGAVPAFTPFSGDLSSAYAAAQEALAPPDGGTWDDNVKYHFTHFDTAGMKANHEFGLDDQTVVAAMREPVGDAVGSGGYMPPGGSLWSDQQAESFRKWDGN